MTPTMVQAVLLAHTAATLYMTGLIWFVQVTHYPLYDRIGRDDFGAYEREHTRRTTWVVAPPMLVELATAAALAWIRPGPAALGGLLLVAVIWLSTAALQVPAHRRLEAGHDPRVTRRLVMTNWIRTAAWTARAGIALWLVA